MPGRDRDGSERVVKRLPSREVSIKGGSSDPCGSGDLARETSKTVRAIHLYEEMELLKPAGRSKGRYRLYGPEALVRIRWIGKLQDLGFSLTDIKAIVKDVESEGRGSSAPSIR